MTARWLESFVDRGQDPSGGMSGSGDVRVGKNGEQLGRDATKDPWSVDVANCARQCGCHGLESFVCRTHLVGFDQQDAEVALVAVGACQLVLEHWPDEAIVEEARGPIDDVEGLRVGIICSYPARRAKDGCMRQQRAASLTGLSLGPAA